jgi:NADP-dependent 3-hydroxy acid dehydrogenase YdfG
MTKGTVVVAGHGPGISDAVARKFGQEGHPVAIVARSADRIAAAADALVKAGIKAKAFPCDLADGVAVRKMLRDVKASLGPVSVLHWNAYNLGCGDLTSAPTAELETLLDLQVVNLVAAVQETLPDLKAAKGAVLATGGGLSQYDAKVDATAVSWGVMGLSIAKAALHKTVGLLHEKLRADGVYVGEVIVLGTVKGTTFDKGGGPTLDPAEIAATFWNLFEKRSPTSVNFG